MADATVIRTKRVPCEGSRGRAVYKTDDGRGKCSACGTLVGTYDSSRVGHGLLVDHTRRAAPVLKGS